MPRTMTHASAGTDMLGAAGAVKSSRQDERGKVAIQSLKHKSACVIDPRTSSAVSAWDGITSLALIFTAIVTPYEVGFLEPARDGRDTLFLINRAIDCVFLADLLLQFNLMYQSSSGSEGTRWVSDHRSIAWHYATSWLFLDALSIGVSGFDYTSLGTVKACPGTGGSEGGGLSNLKVLRTLRALRLIKLVRLLRASRILRRFEVKFAINYGMLALVKCVCGMVLLSHWFACIWGLQAGMQENILHTWVGDDLYCRNVTTTPPLLGEEPPLAPGELACEIRCDSAGDHDRHDRRLRRPRRHRRQPF
jgi:hypothetical protein